MSQGDQELVDRLDEVWRSIEELGHALTETEWKTPTECPGWSVQDNVAHIVGIESSILGRPEPDHVAPAAPHVKNDIGRRNEVWVDSRRSRRGAEVLAEFREVTGERVARLRTMGDAEFGAESWTPVGPGTVRDLLPFRIFDCWVHEQDIRRALGRPGHLDGPAAEFSLERIVGALPYVVGKKVKPADGTTVVFATGAGAPRLSVRMVGGRAQPVGEEPADATVRLEMDTDTLVRLACGRGDREEILASGAVRMAGDEELGSRIGREMNFLF